MSHDRIREAILNVIPKYSVTRVVLFGSRAGNTDRDDSDIDLIMEFSKPVSLITLSEIRFQLEDILGIPVDIVHGPVQKTDLIEVKETVELYAA